MSHDSEEQLIRKGKLKRRCSEPVVFACNTCGEEFSPERWTSEGNECPACAEGAPVAHATCRSCARKLPESAEGLDCDVRDCQSVNMYHETGKCVFDVDETDVDGSSAPIWSILGVLGLVALVYLLYHLLSGS